MKRIFLLVAPVILFILAFRPVSSITITGKVHDDAGSAVASATIQVKGSTTATVTDKQGSFSIVVPDKNSVLVVSALGYATQELKLAGKTSVTISLKQQTYNLEEVVVVSGHAQRRSHDIAYSRAKTNASPVAGIITTTDYERKRFYHGDTNHGEFNTEDYDHIAENRFLKATENPLSTFSIDVDAASYSNVRRILNQGMMPPAGAVRIEEMVNYFNYEYPQPTGDKPFSINTEMAVAPWNKEHKLLLIGLQGKKIAMDNLPASNLVFLVDVSGSMETPNKLPLVKASMKLLTDQLREQDKVSIVVYAGAAGLVLKPTSGADKQRIKDAIDNLQAGGSTAGGAGIKLAYKTANEFFVKNGNNRVILCTDGDFNVGASSDDEMETLIEQERKSGVFLTVLGYGMDNYKDNKMQKLADKGNGNHAYIDGMSEAKKVLVNEFGGTLFTIAKDVKLQIEFNPAKVQGYRLIGYENRMLAKEDFNDDKKDAGELGSGHTVTALYEIIPTGINSSFLANVDPLKYQGKIEKLSNIKQTDELVTVKFRYKAPDGEVSRMIEHAIVDNKVNADNTSDNFRFAASVAEFGMLLRNSKFKGQASFDNVLSSAKKAKGQDDEGYRSEFIRMVGTAQLLAKENNEQPVEETTRRKTRSNR
jgi:Ca-activated chloride channel family protein